MKRIRLRIHEQATYEREYTVPDNFQESDDDALLQLWLDDTRKDTALVSIDERWLHLQLVTKSSG